MDFWKIIILWNQSSLGNIKVLDNDCIDAADPDCTGSRRVNVYCISDIDCSGDYFADNIKSIITEGRPWGGVLIRVLRAFSLQKRKDRLIDETIWKRPIK